MWFGKRPGANPARAMVFVVAIAAARLGGGAWCRAEEREQIEVVIAEGVGADVEGARRDAYRNAVRQAVGAYVDSETIVANDELITDRVVTLSPAFVEKAEPVAGSEKKEGGLVRLRVRAHVRITKLLDELAAGKIKTRPLVKKVDTSSLLAELTTKTDQHEARRGILAKLFSDYPESCLTVTQTGKETIDKRPDGKIFLSVPLAITPNDERYAAFSKTLCEVLSATKRRSGEFKVDGGKFGPDPRDAEEGLQQYLRNALTDRDYLLGVIPEGLQSQVRASCDKQGHSPIVGMGAAYQLWDGGPKPGISLAVDAWETIRWNSRDDWFFVCITASKKDHRQTTWKWFHVTANEYLEWFASVPKTFRCKTQLLDKSGDEVAGEDIELGKIGASEWRGNQALWCVPMYVNLYLNDRPGALWYTPEFTIVRSIEIDADDAASIASLRVCLERGSPPDR
jgi:hypothetical protein